MAVLGPMGCPKPSYGDFTLGKTLQSTWTLVLSLDPNAVIDDPHFVRVVGFLTNRDVPVMPVAPNMTS